MLGTGVTPFLPINLLNGVKMVDEEVQEEQENAEMKAAETENGDSPDDDMDSLMNELEQQKTSPEGTGGSGDLSSLITEKADSTEENIDEMLDSASDTTSSMDDTPVEEGVDLEFLQKMPLTMTLEVGRAKMTINDLLSLGQGSVLELHRLVGESLDLFANGKLIAQGEVVIVNEKFGAKLTNIISPEERIKQMDGMDKTS
ncbi:MAG: flagellar motor switch protein FliN [SAR324 cluster bacterium]|jgi:flagellar motor switch protein FliN/FliY|uniref:Flagellar motor switch protein FliN n=1 Tax=SAR324 cluster bacterium TaxID=2024889 RepID=A0A432G574_9DELT|nr:MAG: flagellar motor switch protein FliN [SAR324 cluster bacterium]RTZ88605.1 MAG: flagellar motor switch protein FliN [SAR324 cluster bacterium]HCB31809.1 flagellar motor switch protein FliN [Deltaproteobacteria bacterium]HIB15575.1 flagellar motor switch protein FliN [Candidatus Lambdaproteobacteria bacterium]